MADYETNPILALWKLLPPEARKAYGSMVNFAAELSSGAAVRDVVDESGNMVKAAQSGNWIDAAAGPAKMTVAALGAIPFSKAAKMTSKTAQETLAPLRMDEAARAARAKELGYTTDVYHATGRDFTQFDNSKSVRQAYGASTHVAADPALANTFSRQIGEGGRTMPLKVKLGKVADAETYKRYADKNDWDMVKTTQALIDDGYDTVAYNHGQFFTPQGGKLVGSQPGQDQAYAILRPENIRSRFAAFDPAKIGDPNIMAGIIPPVAIGGAVTVPGLLDRHRQKEEAY